MNDLVLAKTVPATRQSTVRLSLTAIARVSERMIYKENENMKYGSQPVYMLVVEQALEVHNN